MIIYIVTSGSYSDYGINAVFTTEEAAQQYLVDIGNQYTHEASIEEYEADLTYAQHAKQDTCWEILFKPGSADVMNLDTTYSKGLGGDWKLYDDGVVRIHVLADTAERAVKVAMERRSIILSMGIDKGEGKL